jgi:Asp-tRNA(Asn)/Glu-tRNA(Gln) amidotransferase A subunit family amidase
MFFCVTVRELQSISCFHWMAGATTFFDQIHTVEKDAVCVARLRNCGVIFIGKANMHELGLGVTGNNPNYGYDQLLHNCSVC